MIRLALFYLFIAALVLQVPGIQAGANKCKMDQGAPCGEKNCTAHGKQTPPYCSPKCHKDCCFCPKSCNGHNPERQQQPEEEQ